MTPQIKTVKDLLKASQKNISADVTLQLWDGSRFEFNRSDAVNIEVVINSADTIRQILFKPNIATVFGLFGQGNFEIIGASPLQLLRATDHVSILKFFQSYGRSKLLRALLPFLAKEGEKLSPRAFVDSWKGQKRNDSAMVSFHYDVSNAFYKLFLDDDMVYTCGYFRDWDNDIHTAQRDKLDHVCRKLRLKPGDKMLDIGCGWGALACHAAQHYGAIVKGVTLSKDQHALGIQNVNERGLTECVDLALLDYRDLNEKNHYDKITSIGMFEHVGRENYDLYYRQINKLLKPRGLYLHHAITRRPTPDLSKFDRPTGYQKAITRYIFPGGELDHIGRSIINLERNGFEVHDTEALREHYRITLEHWHDRLWANRTQAIDEAGEEILRLWLLYFALFVVGFDRGVVNIFQTLASKRRLGASGLPPTRDDIYN